MASLQALSPSMLKRIVHFISSPVDLVRLEGTCTIYRRLLTSAGDDDAWKYCPNALRGF
jgi:hypothetical protein